MEAHVGHSRLCPEVWKEIFAHLPMMWRAMCCRVCKVWQKDLEQPHQGHGDDILVDYGLGTLCSVLATKGVDEVMRRIRLHFPSGIPADLGRTDQVRRFVQRHLCAEIKSVDEWMQLASQEPDAGWLCKGVSKTNLEGVGKSLIRQVGKPHNFSMLLDTVEHSDNVTFVGYSPDGSTIASACLDCTVRLLDAKTMEVKGILKGHSDGVTCVAYSPDGKQIASASHDKTVKIWDSETKQEVCSLKRHSDSVTCVVYSPDGAHIVTASYDKNVKMWDAETKKEVCSLRKGHADRVNFVAYSPDGKHIASASQDKTVKMWDAETRQLVCSLKGHSKWVRCVTYSPDSKTVASASDDGTVKLWDLETMEEVGTLKGHSGSVLSVAYSPDGSQLASAGGYGDNTVKLWDPKTMECKGTLRHSGSVRCVTYSPDGKHIATASGDKTVKVWDAGTMEEKGTLRGHSRDNPECTCRHYEAHGYWKTDVNAECPVRGHSDCVKCVAYSPDNKSIASASHDETVKLWDLSGETPVEKGTLRGHVASWQHLDPDTKALAAKIRHIKSSDRTGQYIVTANYDMVYVYMIDSDGEKHGEPLACFRTPTYVSSVSCKGTSAVVGCEDGQVGVVEPVFVNIMSRYRCECVCERVPDLENLQVLLLEAPLLAVGLGTV